MKEFIDKFRKELEQFWKWEGLTLEDYENGKKQFIQDECFYPNWNKLVEYSDKTIEILREGVKSLALINSLLELIAIDNEGEITMEKCEELLETEAIEWIAEAAICFPMCDARWQIAELLGRSNNEICYRYLLVFIEDENKYVQRRALISLGRINPKKAEEISIEKLSDNDDYMMRLVSLMILREVRSEYLNKAIKILENDQFECVQREIELAKEDIFNWNDV